MCYWNTYASSSFFGKKHSLMWNNTSLDKWVNSEYYKNNNNSTCNCENLNEKDDAVREGIE